MKTILCLVIAAVLGFCEDAPVKSPDKPELTAKQMTEIRTAQLAASNWYARKLAVERDALAACVECADATAKLNKSIQEAKELLAKYVPAGYSLDEATLVLEKKPKEQAASTLQDLLPTSGGLAK